MTVQGSISVRSAVPGDEVLIWQWVRELAEYERLLPEVTATAEDFARELFGPTNVVKALIGEWDGTPVGYALYFYNFSTFLGKRGIYLEDLYVNPANRGRGVGKALLKRLAEIAVIQNCGRLEWAVLDWNQPAIEFYQALGARLQSDWIINRLTGDPLRKLGAAGEQG